MYDYVVPYVFPYAVGLAMWVICFLIYYRDGKKVRAVLFSAALAVGLIFLALDAEVKTGKYQVAEAIECWPHKYKKPSGCKFKRADGVMDNATTPEWVKPGDKVVLTELKTKITDRRYYKYLDQDMPNK